MSDQLIERLHDLSMTRERDLNYYAVQAAATEAAAELTRLRAEVETMRNAAIHWHDERDTIEHSSIKRCAEVCVQRALMHQSRGHTGGYHMPAAQMEAVQCAAAILALKEGER